MPKPEPTTRMPDPNDPQILEERRRAQGDALKRNGRDSTILSDALSGTAGAL